MGYHKIAAGEIDANLVELLHHLFILPSIVLVLRGRQVPQSVESVFYKASISGRFSHECIGRSTSSDNYQTGDPVLYNSMCS